MQRKENEELEGKIVSCIILAMLLMGMPSFPFNIQPANAVEASAISSGFTTTFPWPKFQYDLANTGFTISPVPHTNTTRWTYQVGPTWTAPAVAEGKIVFGDANFTDNSGTLYALNARNGTLLWKFRTNGWIESPPAIYNGKVYFGSDDRNLYCLNLTTGQEIWKTLTDYPIVAGSTVVEDTVYLGNGALYAFDANSGTLTWSLYILGSFQATPSFSNGKIIAGASNSYVYAWNATNGSLIWTYKTDGSVWASPAVDGGRVYVPSKDGNLYSLSESAGTLLWKTAISGIYQAGDSSAAIAYGIVYVGTQENSPPHRLHAINATTGAIIWTFETNAEIYLSPAIADGKVYFGTWGQDFYALDAMTGEVVWHYQLTANEEKFGGYGSAIADGVLYVGTRATTYEYGRIIAFGARTPTESLEGLIRTIQSWNLARGTQKSLVTKLQDAIKAIDVENEELAIRKIMDFINQVQSLRGKKLTNDQADYLTSEALRITDLING